jgi:hypothetical protein
MPHFIELNFVDRAGYFRLWQSVGFAFKPRLYCSWRHIKQLGKKAIRCFASRVQEDRTCTLDRCFLLDSSVAGNEITATVFAQIPLLSPYFPVLDDERGYFLTLKELFGRKEALLVFGRVR